VRHAWRHFTGCGAETRFGCGMSGLELYS